jgi:hypothetical protein
MYRNSFSQVRSAILTALVACDMHSEAIVVPVHRAIEAIRPLAFRGQESCEADITGRCNPGKVATGFVTQLKEVLERDLAPLKVTISRELQHDLTRCICAELSQLNLDIEARATAAGEPVEAETEPEV